MFKGREERKMKVYELIQNLCENEPNAEVVIRVIGDVEHFNEYVEDSKTADLSATEVWASIDNVKYDKYKRTVFIDRDLERL